MKILFDTSVLIAGTISAHPQFKPANTWLKKVMKNKVEMIVASHSLAEYYSVVTKLPVSPRISPSIAMKLIEDNIIKHAKTIHLTTKELLAAIKNIEQLGLTGGITYDALIFAAAIKGKADKLLTFNTKDFQQLSLDNPKFILAP